MRNTADYASSLLSTPMLIKGKNTCGHSNVTSTKALLRLLLVDILSYLVSRNTYSSLYLTFSWLFIFIESIIYISKDILFSINKCGSEGLLVDNKSFFIFSVSSLLGSKNNLIIFCFFFLTMTRDWERSVPLTIMRHQTH